MQSHSRDRSAFTLVELLVVIAIIGVLVALLLPAVQAAREASRRAQCSNNIKQIVLGIHNFHDTRGTVPPAVAFDPIAGTAATPGSFGNGWGWLTMMLPYVEQKNLYDTINFNASVSCRSQALVHAARIGGFRCPSDPLGGKLLGDRGISNTNCQDGSGSAGVPVDVKLTTLATAVTACASNYLGSFGDGYVVGDTVGYTWGPNARVTYGCGGCSQTSANFVQGPNCPEPGFGFGGGPYHRGIWDYRNTNKPIRFADITDGLSNTVMVGEISIIASGYDMAWFTNTGNVNGTSLPINFNLLSSIQQKFFFCPGCTTGQPWRGRGFASHHPNGVNFGMADGSVTFVNQQINQIVYNAMGSRAGGEAPMNP
jgi:prepilin-type N-terminal cleavage/methylation domain-containing protein/prepilin-type processing-associated H-X9-DG protein